MYQRIYPSSDIPPNYKGNAFDKLTDSVEKEEKCHSPLPEKVREEEKPLLIPKKERNIALDDIIIGALIILLLNSHADDELLLILALLLFL
ncbi:MAG: hypothetical protein IKU52_08255 [Clostridia bacterium]|nr:hypothetical protein [Clostridia bacterium]